MTWMKTMATTLIVGAAMLGALDTPAEAKTEPTAADVPYYAEPPDEYAAERCRLWLYAPKPANGKPVTDYPTIVFFHGGGLNGGDRTADWPLIQRMTAEGIAVISVHYRLSPKVKCPAYIQDAAAAAAWTIDHIKEYGGDPARVFVCGHSAGGYLAAMIALDPQYLAAFGKKPGQLAGSIPISGQMITHSAVRAERGIPRSQPIMDEFAPTYHAAKPGPPFLCVVGGKDNPARLEENAYFVAARQAAGITTARLLAVPDRNHGSIFHLHMPNDIVAKTILEFVRDPSAT